MKGTVRLGNHQVLVDALNAPIFTRTIYTVEEKTYIRSRFDVYKSDDMSQYKALCLFSIASHH